MDVNEYLDPKKQLKMLIDCFRWLELFEKQMRPGKYSDTIVTSLDDVKSELTPEERIEADEILEKYTSNVVLGVLAAGYIKTLWEICDNNGLEFSNLIDGYRLLIERKFYEAGY